MKALPLIGLFLLCLYGIHAQDCSCAENFTWLKETFEQNDAGFQYVIDQKGAQEYQKHCDAIRAAAETISDKKECVNVLFQWLRFFREGHIWIGLRNDDSPMQTPAPDVASIQNQFKDWETLTYDANEFDAYLSTIESPGIEGVWASPPYAIGIRKVQDTYIGFIIEGDGVYWTQSQVKLKIHKEAASLSAKYYMKDHSEREFTDVALLGNNYLRVGFLNFTRIKPTYPADEHLNRHFRFAQTQSPLFETVSPSTAILRIPSFAHSEKRLIDSLIDANWQHITNTQNLIIDLRNNGGGSDGSFQKILPLIYTNPIRTVGVELLSTPLNNQRMVEFINDPEWADEDKIWAKEALEKLNAHPGEFVNLDSSTVTTETFDTVLPYPQHVGVIINHGCGSTTEQFLLTAKQSKKVKLFGATTQGVLDISNMYSAYSPCGDIELAYCLSRSMRIPEMTIDGKGIQPDYFIDNSVSEYDWIPFVENMLNAKN